MLFPRIYTAPTEGQANVVISFLRAEGFHPLDLQTSPSIWFGGADVSYHVQVPPEEVPAAMEALRANGYGAGLVGRSDTPNTG